MATHIEEAFRQVCTQAEEGVQRYVTLYVTHRGFGGHEEGGWYWTDHVLVASQAVSTLGQAERMKSAVQALADRLTRKAEDRRNLACAMSVEYVEQRDPMADVEDYFPEPDGGDTYWVAIEDKQGEHVSQGDRVYS